jgi:hypothetical protein
MEYKVYKIRKPGGGFRIIHKPDQELLDISNDYLRILTQTLNKNGWYKKYTDHSFAYQKGKSCKTLVEKLIKDTSQSNSGLLYDLYSIDVKNFFGSISMYSYAAAINDLYREGLISELQNSFFDKIWSLIYIGDGTSDIGTGIAQGNPLSPIISNIIGWHYFDKDRFGLNDIGGSRFGHYYRYSDNIFIIAERRTSKFTRPYLLSKLKKHMEDLHGTFEFTWKVSSNLHSNSILGIRIGKKPQLEDKKWLRSVFYRASIRGPLMMGDEDIKDHFGLKTFEDFQSILKGLSSYAQSIDPSMKEYIDNHPPMTKISEMPIPSWLKIARP